MGASISLDDTTITITQTLAGTGINLNKTGTGAGTPLLIQNAGTGDDLQIITTRAAATGVIIDVHQDSATPADADVIFELQVNGEDSASTKTEYGRIRFLSDDVTDATEDASFQLALFVAGTQSTCLSVVGPLVTIGDGTSNAILDTSGALDLILRTNAGTNSGTIRIYDGVNGNIEIETNGTGDLTLPATGIVQGGTTATRCTFAVGGTTGQGFDITTATITSGDVVRINHSVSGTLSGGNLLNLAIDGTAYYSFGEVAMTIAGTAGSNVLSITAGDVVMSDGSLTITDADNANTFAVTNNTATTASVIEIAGSGVFTGTGTSSFMELSPSGLTGGTAFAITAAALTTGNGLVITSNAQTTGIALQLTSSGTITTTGRMLSILADTATTSTGLVDISADALTTGYAVAVSSDSNEVMTSGRLMSLVHSASGTTVAAKTGSLVSLTSSITESGTSTQDFDGLSIVRTSIHNTAGTLTATGSIAYLELVSTETLATLTDTTIGLEILMSTVGTGDGIQVTHPSLTGVGIDIVSSASTGSGEVITANSLTTGTGLRITSSGTITTTGELLDVIGNTATTCTGLVRVSGTGLTDGWDAVMTGGGANATASGGVLDIVAGAATLGTAVRIRNTGIHAGATGVLIDALANSATAADLVILSGTGLTTGNCILATGGGANMTAGGQVIDVVMGAATVGQGVRVATSGVYTGTTGILDVNATAATTGIIASIDGTGLNSGTALELLATAATLTTGWYLRCNDGGVNKFAITRNGLAFRQTTAPTIAVTTQNGITAAAVTAGSSDSVCFISTTGTNNNGGDSVLTITYNGTWAVAPRVFLTPTNNSGRIVEPYVSSTTTTTAVITIPASASSGATPGWNVWSVEPGS